MTKTLAKRLSHAKRKNVDYKNDGADNDAQRSDD